MDVLPDYSKLLQDLSGSDDQVLSGLTVLLNVLTYRNEQSLGNFPVDVFADHMVKFLDSPIAGINTASSACVFAFLEAHTASTRCLINANVLPLLADHLLNVQTMETAENCLKSLEKIAHFRAAEIGQSVGIAPFLACFDRFTIPTKRLAISGVRRITMAHNLDSYATFLPKLIEIAQSATDRIRNDAVDSIESIASNVQPSLVPADVIQSIAGSAHFLRTLVHLSIWPQHISSILSIRFDFEGSLARETDSNNQKFLLLLILNILPVPQNLNHVEFPRHVRPPESEDFARAIQPLLVKLIMENPIHLEILLKAFIATLSVQLAPFTDELLLMLKSIVTANQELGVLVLTVLTFYETDPMIDESGILAVISRDGVGGNARNWFMRSIRSIAKKSTSGYADRISEATIKEIIELIRTNKIRKIEFLNRGIDRCLALFTHDSANHRKKHRKHTKAGAVLAPDDSQVLADYLVGLLGLIPLPQNPTKEDFNDFMAFVGRKIRAEISLPSGDLETVEVSGLDPVSILEGWYNQVYKGYNAKRLARCKAHCPLVLNLIFESDLSKLTHDQLSFFFRMILPDGYPTYHVNSRDYRFDGNNLILEISERCYPDRSSSCVKIDLVAGELRPLEPSAPPDSSFRDLNPILDLFTLLPKTARISCNPVFSQRVRNLLCSPEGLATRDSRALGTVYKCPDLFDFSTRQLAFKLAACDLRGTIFALSKEFGVQLPHADHTDVLKARVRRDSIFPDGLEVMMFCGFTKSRLDVSFVGEEGIGFGPTHEFFTLFSREFCRTSSGIFRSDTMTSVYCKAQAGLFFSPVADVAHVRMLGTFVAKALQMGCLVDMNLNPALFAFIRGQSVTVDDIDPLFARSLAEPKGVVGMPFVYPGLDLPLKPDGEAIDVTPETVGEWVDLVCDFTCGNGLESIREAFLDGFERVMPFWVLNVFDDSEICAILRGESAKFNMDELREHVIVSNGFMPGSPEIEMLFEVISEFSIEEQRLLIQFITGYAQLPIGGLAALEPKLTIARKLESDPDKLLPSVMTCKHYFKIPAYSSRQIIRERILLAISEGQSSFDLT